MDVDPDRKAESASHSAREEYGSSSKLIECTQCGAIREGGKPCFHCGFLPQRGPRDIIIGAGELGLVDGGRKVMVDTADPIVRAQWHSMLTYIASERGYARGWIAPKYKEKFGQWPPWGAVAQPIPPTSEVRSWVRSRMIAFAKGTRSA
jgi:DNA repair protein RadD